MSDGNLDIVVRDLGKAIRSKSCLIFAGAGVSAWSGPANYSCKHISVDTQQLLTSHPVYSLNNAHEAIDAIERHAQSLQLLPSILRGDREGAPPSWYLHACMLAAFSKSDQAQALAEQWPLGTVAEKLHSLDPSFLAQLMQELFGHCKPNHLHRVLASFSLPVLVTTNFDCCLEQAWNYQVGRVNSCSTDRDLHSNGLKTPLIIKAHGSLLPENIRGILDAEDYLSEIVLTDRQYWSFPKERELLMKHLEVLFSLSKVLFLGYSLRDFNITEIFHRLSALQRHNKMWPVAVFPRIAERDRGVFAARGVSIIEHDLAEFVDEVWLQFAEVHSKVVDEPHRGLRYPNGNPAIPVGILRRRAEQSEEFKRKLKWLVVDRVFPGRLLLSDAWRSSDFDEWVDMLWLRRIGDAHSNEETFYELPVEIRQALDVALKEGQ